MIHQTQATADTAIPAVVPYKAKPLPLGSVKLTGGPLKHAQDLDAEYLLKLEPDRMFAAMRKLAGLEPKAQQYGGWDAEGRQLTGHIAGHYLSAVSYMYQATGDERFKQRADYVVQQFREVQEKQGDGYIGALMGYDKTVATTAPTAVGNSREGREPPVVDGKLLFKQLAEGKIYSGGFDLNGMWSPWYVQHKIYAGLRDAYRLTGNKDALAVEIKFSEWCESIVGNFTKEQDQKMLETEFGAMNEVFVDLYADTGDARWLKLADRFYHHAIVDPLARGENILPGKHGNTQVPKLLGHLIRYEFTGDKADGDAARFFWHAVVDHHSFASGGHGYDEYFGPPDKFSGQVDGAGQRSPSLRTAETCNVYNMLKYTRELFALEPDVKLADFHERALYNHILASIDPKDGRTCYMVPVGPGVSHEYQDMFESFTCCVGTGMESHALHAHGIYYENGDRLWVNLYAPTKGTWPARGVTFTVDTDVPLGEAATFKIEVAQPTQFTLALRRPAWAEGFAIKVNGQAVTDLGTPDSFVDVSRTWSNGDTVEIALPKSLRVEPLPDNGSRVSLMWGPLVLAGDMGERSRRDDDRNSVLRRLEFPVLVSAGKPLADSIETVDAKRGAFRTAMSDGKKIDLVPFYTLHNRRYTTYWDQFTPEQWAARQAEYDAEQARQKALADATIAYVQPGEMQPERDFNFQGEGSNAMRHHNQAGRSGGKWISFDIPVEAAGVKLIVTGEARQNSRYPFILEVEGTRVEAIKEISTTNDGFVDIAYSIPNELLAGKQKVSIRFVAGTDERGLASIFGVRVMRDKK